MGANPNRFVRRTTLQADEYRKNFRQIDRDAIELVKSPEAKRVTHLMGTLYLTLVDAPVEYWEREGVLRFAGTAGEGRAQTAWQQLVALLDCGNTTAKKALDWMHEQGVIGYYAGKNGAGIRIFINRAVTSIGRREGQKNLRLVRTPTSASHTPEMGMPFKDSFADPESLDSDTDPRAPKSCAPETETDDKCVHSKPQVMDARVFALRAQIEARADVGANGLLVEQLAREIVPQVKAAAAAEHERTREWFITHALPKAVRVSQHSAYDVLRAHGLIDAPRARKHGRAESTLDAGEPMPAQTVPRAVSDDDITELAYGCIALFEVHGQPIERTIADMSSAAGGFLPPADAAKVRAKVEALIHADRVKE